MSEPNERDRAHADVVLPLMPSHRDDPRYISAVACEFAAYREEIQAECAADVCAICGCRSLGYGKASGPNKAGNWVHVPNRAGKPVLCSASGIWARMRASAGRGGGCGGR
jgi:hypothetical protein